VYKKLFLIIALTIILFASLAFFTNLLILNKHNTLPINNNENVTNKFKNIQLPFKIYAKEVYDTQNEIIGEKFEIIYNKNELIFITGEKAIYNKETKIISILSGTISFNGYIMTFKSGDFDTKRDTLSCVDFSLKGKNEQMSSKSADIDFASKKLIAKNAVIKSTEP
jgi:hypothetical protein